MEPSELRLECLKLAVDFHDEGLGNVETCLSTAEKFIAFVEGLPLERPQDTVCTE